MSTSPVIKPVTSHQAHACTTLLPVTVTCCLPVHSFLFTDWLRKGRSMSVTACSAPGLQKALQEPLLLPVTMSKPMHRHQFHAAATSKDIPGNGAVPVPHWTVLADSSPMICRPEYSLHNPLLCPEREGHSRLLVKSYRTGRVRSGRLSSAH